MTKSISGLMGLIYEVEELDRLTTCSGDWDRFAQENGWFSGSWGNLTSSTLWDHITDLTTQKLYRRLMAQVRQENKELTFDLRCDSPWLQRYLRMTLEPGSGTDWVRFCSRPVRLQPHNLPYRFNFLKEPQPGAHSFCSFCNQVEFGGLWKQISNPTSRLKVPQSSLTLVAQTCPSCAQRLGVLVGQPPPL
ncbi:MAG: hypothetical protein RRB13_14310 [bacterium]|nr:hypothetical protein [bacterium]